MNILLFSLINFLVLALLLLILLLIAFNKSRKDINEEKEVLKKLKKQISS